MKNSAQVLLNLSTKNIFKNTLRKVPTVRYIKDQGWYTQPLRDIWVP